MKKKVNINRPELSSEQISAGKNFGSLVKNYPALTNPFRKTSWRTKGILWVVLLSVGLTYYVVSREAVYKEYDKDFPTQQWLKSKKVNFNPEISDTAHTYKITLVLRHVQGFQFRDMSVKLSSTAPSGKSTSKEYTFPVMKNETEYLSDCAGDICDLETVIEKSVHFSEAGKYSYTIEHTMPVDALPNVMEFGLIIEKNP
jgi:gliding motility-associated lipoprotein GldH